MGIAHELRPADVVELESGPPEQVAVENARLKAHAVQAAAGELILGADTVVALDGQVLPKPRDEEEAARWLGLLSGRFHDVCGGLCLVEGERSREAVATTRVLFRELGEADIGHYVDSGEWRERAGGYAIQGRGAALVAAIEGDYLNVVGLPVATLLGLEPRLLDPAPR